MSAKPLPEQIADLKNVIAARESMRSVLGDAVVNTTLAVLKDQLTELERQFAQRDAANQARRRLVTVLFVDFAGFTALRELGF